MTQPPASPALTEADQAMREEICIDCGKPIGDDGDSDIPACAGCIQANREEGARLMAEADAFRNTTPPPIPVRARYYITECEHCGWIGSSEQCGGGDNDIVCPVCCSSICGDEPDEADIAKHGEAVMQRILDVEAKATAAEQEAARWGSEYADAMDARMADAITMERIGSALAVFARMDAMDEPEGVRLNEWLPAITGARAALKEAGLQRLLDRASGTVESEARRRP
jgi:hypothetical protein